MILTLTVMEVAETLRISRAGAYDLVRTEVFPALKIGSRIVIPNSAIKHLWKHLMPRGNQNER